jgi:hypothetical protein
MVNKGGRPRKDGLGKKWTKTIWFRITFDHLKDPYAHSMAFNNSEALSRLIKDYLNSIQHPAALIATTAPAVLSNNPSPEPKASDIPIALPIKIKTAELPAIHLSTPMNQLAQEPIEPELNSEEDTSEATAKAKSKWLSNHDY